MTSCDVFSTACDVYSFAVLLWELATFSVPFEDVAEESQVDRLNTTLQIGQPTGMLML